MIDKNYHYKFQFAEEFDQWFNMLIDDLCEHTSTKEQTKEFTIRLFEDYEKWKKNQ